MRLSLSLCLYKHRIHVCRVCISTSDRCVNLRELKARWGYSYVQKTSDYSTSQYSSSLRLDKVPSPFTVEIFFFFIITSNDVIEPARVYTDN